MKRKRIRKPRVHKITLEKEGGGMDGTLRPICTCGWRGRAVGAYNNWQHTVVQDQGMDHVKRSK